MKKQFKKAILSLTFVVLFGTGIICNAYAKFWGWQTTGTTDWADGICTYRQTCQVHYIFWIRGAEQCDTEKLYCLEKT